MNIVCVDNSVGLDKKRSRAVLSRWGFKVAKSTFICPGFTITYIEKEVLVLRRKGCNVSIVCSIFNSNGIKIDSKVL